MFKNLIYTLEQAGHKYFVVVNEKEITSLLLKAFDIKFKKVGTNKQGIISKLLQLFQLTFKTILAAYRFKPDIYIGQAIPHLAFTSLLFRKPFIIFEDTESSVYLQKITNPFASAIVTPSSYYKTTNKQLKINGGFELAYLHKKHFLPNPSVLSSLGVTKDDKYIIIRFVSWNANHDMGHAGITDENKIKAVKEFSALAKVFISSEASIPKELQQYSFSLPPNQMHDAIYYSSMVYGESATMAAEAAYLGTPAIYLDNVGRGYTDALERDYKLIYTFSESCTDQIKSIKKGVDILTNHNSRIWQDRHQLLINNSIDVSSFMYWFVTNFPESQKIIKSNPDYQNMFK